MTLEELEKKLSELEEFRGEIYLHIDALKKLCEEPPKPPHPKWKAKFGEEYFVIRDKVIAYYSGNDGFDDAMHNIGNYFSSKEEAEFMLERLKVLAEMNEWAGKNYDGAYIYYHRPSDEIMINWDGDSTNCFGDIRFKCVDDAENCVKAVGEDRIKKYYFMIPEEKSND